ncbi:Serine/threonine-protein kinase PrkC [Rubripirellula amarantea]|uniref:non-specific serine/threonine protein kinase n=1 Tax=Rubripirellula amarantea TaxID=2527999 RepID=A0A5C5WW53_9BACT|nr:serine/threonine-protein kinase [Rubripirellula amarantea]TWT54165.1 Serine/threonine-protein kinase PrkC [Rubripirellula amarantea]
MADDANPNVNDDGLKDDQAVDRAFAAYLKSCDSGEFSTREEFLAQFPEIASELKELMDAADMFGRAKSVSLNIDVNDVPVSFSPSDAPFFISQSSNVLSHDAPRSHDPSAETIGLNVPGAHEEQNEDPAVTLPMANRAKGDPGPTLPYDLGDYLLLDVIGRGGMGVVYRAFQNELDREVAVKMIRSGMLASEAEVKRFYTEAQAAARLHHPGIVSVFQFGQRAGHHFFSMEYVRGTDLQRKINAQQLDPIQAATYVRDVARAIHHAHEKGVLHRDLKPANVLIDNDDQIHVTDFGLAKHLDCDSSVTASGDAVGTPHYMAPEQAIGQSDRATCQTDVYSLGAVLFAALAGRPPLVGETVMQTLTKVAHEPAPGLRSIRSDTPVDLETIVAKCLEKKPNKRYLSAAKLADELDAFLEDRPIEARPRSVAMKTWHWIEGVPLVGALTGRRVLHSSQSHRRFQAAMLLIMLLVPIFTIAAMTTIRSYHDRMPALVRLAGGLEGGIYTELSNELARRLSEKHSVKTSVTVSEGSLDNHQQLLSGQIDLAPLQATAISGDHLMVVAPLFYEVLHVLVQVDASIQTIDDFRGHRVAVGPAGSGSRATAELVLDSLNLNESQVQCQTMDWEQLFADDPPDAAMICMGRQSSLVARLLASGKWRLLPIESGVEIALQHPTLRPMSIPSGDYSALTLPGGVDTIATVGTTAFLTVRDDAPADLVTAMLEALYADPPPRSDLIPRRRAAEWQGLAFHPAARRYYQSVAK